MNTVSHIQHGLWRHPQARQSEFDDIQLWIDLAKTLERGKVDALFLADVVGLYGPGGGKYDTNAYEGVQFPAADPLVLASALATHTTDLGLAITSSVIQAHPFDFARKISTLDHLSKGRVGWNVVTSSLDGAARNFDAQRLEGHDERYEWAEEYLEVVYQLWEGSWEDGAVLRDKQGAFADASRIHRINHHGRRYRVDGPHMVHPSPQRTPVIFQAGSSPRGRRFAAQHADAQFLLSGDPEKTRALIADTRELAVQSGRSGADIKFFLGLSFVIGSTEEEARRKEREIDEYLSPEGFLLHSNFGYDPVTGEQLDPDTPLSALSTEQGQSHLLWLKEAAQSEDPSIADLARLSMKLRGRAVGTPEQIADELETWQERGVDGINIMNWTLPGSYEEFVDYLVPTLQERGLSQREYQPGTLREKLGGRAHVPSSHPAAGYRKVSA